MRVKTTFESHPATLTGVGKPSASLFDLDRSASVQTRSQPRSSAQPQRKAAQPARFEGTWGGTVTGKIYGAGSPTYSYAMRLERRGKSSFVGTSVIRGQIDTTTFGVMTLQGRVVNGSLLFKETSIINQQLPLFPIFHWCLKEGRLRLSNSGGRTFLTGPWADPGCNYGQITLQKQIF